ncbi:MAG: D-arabinono-1,4-lactone oxidase [Candidatus Nanopelagicales bacterium]|nr:D-arabinono-1,4-lactone oxidase [Candidatus Nanopelagicales bacterium]MDZ4249820.1 D-arabinono-1,4-lactone oxidase [Candidatus Nanopelagicales bacterium]
MTRTIRNWDRTLAWTPAVVHEPRDAEEVSQIVQRVAARGGRVKAVGSSLSWSDAADIPDEVVLGTNLTGIEVDRAARRATIGTGAKLKDVNDTLGENGLSFENFGSITMQTAGGYTGTGSHGTGGRTPILSSFIEAMELVDGLGNVHQLDASHEPELFSAARVHLGALGVVTKMTFRLAEAFDLEERLEIVDFDKALENLDAYVDGNDYCKLWWLPYSDNIQVYMFNKTTKQRTPITLQERFDATGLSGLTFAGLLGLSRRRPSMAPWLLPAVEKRAFRDHTRVDASDKIIKYAGTIPRHQETEYAIPRTSAAEGIEAMRQLVLTSTGYKVNFTQEVRFVAGDDIPMSPAYGRDSCFLGGYVSSLKWAPRYFLDFEALMAKYSGRPHWGKSFDRKPEALRELYPKYDEFNALRVRCDPQGVFRNRFLDRVFPPEG